MDVFAQDVLAGLSAEDKFLPSRYFYDAQGDQLFQRIMKMPEYYPTPCEYEIFSDQKADILEAIKDQTPFNLVELGAGDGYKTKVLLQHFDEKGVPFRYLPVDISQSVLQELEADLQKELPDLQVETLHYEYFEALEALNKYHDEPKVILFLGGNIGNFTAARAERFFKQLHQSMRPGDRLICGIDLKKDPRKILKAYNDEQGITKAFNLNVLRRINRELQGDFTIEDFDHFPSYDPVSGECRSYLISKKDQSVKIKALKKEFSFKKAEPIHTEISKKYHLSEVEDLAKQCGFAVQRHFTDRKQYFVDSLWVKTA